LTAHVLKPGGVFSFIEASDPRGWLLRPLYMFHLLRVLPLVERVFLRGAQDFTMIGAYSTRFGDARAFGDMLAAQGLEVQFKRHFFGCATGVSGRKPRP
jgi:demethylmenaquinone methyltransferase/2-methoxy-6-polyprenyl-1,4-benzoquinol methylase